MTAGGFHLRPDVIQSVGAALRAKFLFDAANRMAETVAQRALAAGFLHTDRNLQLRLGELRVTLLGEVHHVAILR